MRFRLSPTGKAGATRFHGAIDNLRVAAGKTEVFSEDFNSISGGGSGRQHRTGLALRHSAGLAGWSKSGLNALHCVQRPGKEKKQKQDLAFHLFEINADGTGLKQLTFGDFDDLDPIYLPDGHLMFSTTRGHTYIRCGPDFPAYILARCDSDGKNIYIISQGNESDGSISGCLVVEGYAESSPASLATLKPMTHLSYTSKLIHNAMSGEHNKVRVDAASLRRLIAWVDANGPYLGDEEIRKIPDPPFKTIEAIGVRPRLASAPNIDRFNVRQDGNAIEAVKDAGKRGLARTKTEAQ